jgi:hypothetical protein
VRARPIEAQCAAVSPAAHFRRDGRINNTIGSYLLLMQADPVSARRIERMSRRIIEVDPNEETTMTEAAPASMRSSNQGAEIFVQPIEIILRFNAGIVNAFQSATVGWMQRRQEAARDTIESFGKLVHCRDIGEALTIQREWVQRSMHRLDEDLSPLAVQTPDLLHEAASAGTTAPEAAPLTTREVESHARAAEQTRQKPQSTEKGRATEKEQPNHRTKKAKSSHRRRS